MNQDLTTEDKSFFGFLRVTKLTQFSRTVYQLRMDTIADHDCNSRGWIKCLKTNLKKTHEMHKNLIKSDKPILSKSDKPIFW